MRRGILVVACLAVGLGTSVPAATVAVTSTVGVLDGNDGACDNTLPHRAATCTDVDGDGFCADQDCDDTDSTVYPGASQACNDGKNNDCDHPEWPGLAYTNEVDDDDDGFSDCAGDCNDASPSVSPGGLEACDSYDDDCDGVLDNSAACDTMCTSSEWIRESTPFEGVVPAFAWSGTAYGVVWADDRDGNWEVYFSRIDEAGHPIGGARRITTNPDRSTGPAIVWTGTEYGVAWQERNEDAGLEIVNFVRLDATGEPLTVPSPVVDGSVLSHGSLVWTGSEFALLLIPDQPGDHPLFIQRLDATGRPIGSYSQVTEGSGQAYAMSMAWTGSGFGLTFRRPADQRLWVTRLDPSGHPIGDEAAVTATPAYGRAVVWNGTGFGFAYDDVSNVYLLLFDENGSVLRETQLTQDPGDPVHSVSMVWTGTEYGVAWMQAGAWTVHYARLDNIGNMIQEGRPFGLTPVTNPKIVWNGSEYGVAIERPSGDSWYFARIACHCIDADLDGTTSCNDCNDANPGCAVDCTDGDGDGQCPPIDCFDDNAECPTCESAPVRRVVAATPGASQEFGRSVAVSADTAIVGAANSAYVFERNAGGPGNWGRVVDLGVPATSVAISGDIAIVGTTGATYLFDRNSGGSESWGEVAELPVSATAVSISGDTAVVGADSTYVFERNAGGVNSWGQVAELPVTGRSVSVSGDTIVVPSGQVAYVFERNAGGPDNWGQTAELTMPEVNFFARSVATDGDTIVVGAFENYVTNLSGSAYVFARDAGGSGQWGQVARLTPPNPRYYLVFGSSVSIDGDAIVVGAPGGRPGNAYVFDPTVGELGAFDAAEGDGFGHSVAVSGTTVVIGFPGDDETGESSGSAYIFDLVCAVCGNGVLERGEECDDGGTADSDGCSATCIACRDADADGFGLPGDVACAGGSATDCDDTNASVYPGAPALCDGIRNDCSDPAWPALPADEADLDGDTYRVCAGDCNDHAVGVHPGATELCNGIDDDCNALPDDGVPRCGQRWHRGSHGPR